MFEPNKVEQEEKRIKDIDAIKKNEELINNSVPAQTYSDSIRVNNKDASLDYQLITETASTDLYSVKKENDKYVCKINLNHNFFDYYPQFKKNKDYEPIIKLLMSFAKAEIKAPEMGTTQAWNLRNLFNQYIREDE